jgi:FkbM family methyltransferase
MISRLTRSPVLRRLGLDVTQLGPGSAVVTRRGARIDVENVEPETWVLQHHKGRRRVGREHKGLSDYVAREHISWLIRQLDINCVLDVGANVGQYAKRLRRGGYTGRIVSFEPVPGIAKKLRDAARDDPEWRVFECALGDADEQAEINVRPGSMSSLLPSSEFGKDWHDRLKESETQKISVRRLDGLFDEAIEEIDDPRVYLKLDTQGYDMQAFAGAGDRLKEIAGMQSEVACVPIYDGMPRLPDQIAAYEAAGFEITGMFPVTRHRASLRVIEFDVTMVRADAVGRDGAPDSNA